MAFFNFFKPKWQHRDMEVRLAAVHEMSSREIEILARIAGSDDDQAVRQAAVAKIEDVDVLSSLAATASDERFKNVVRARRNTRLAEVVLTVQEDIVLNEVLSRIDDAQTLAGIVLEAEAPRIRLQAIALITDERVLAGLLEKPCGKEVSVAALAKIDDPGLLKRLADSARNRAARRFAAEKLAKLERQANADDDIVKELETLAKEATKLAESRQWEQAAARFSEIQTDWLRLDPAASHSQKVTVDEAVRQFTERRRLAEKKRADELRRAEEFSQETAKKEALCQVVEELIGSPAAESDSRFEHALTSWPEDGHFPALASRFNEACGKYKEARAAIISERKIFGGFAEEVKRLELLVSSSEWRRVPGQLDDLLTRVGEKRFLYLAKLELKDRLTAVRKRYEERLQASKEKEVRHIQEAIARRQEICAELERLIDQSNRPEAEKRVREIETFWRALKPLPDGEQDSDQERRFKEIMARFQSRQNEFYHQQDWQLWANRNLKDELCRQVEALDSIDDLAFVAERIKKAQSEWKKVGPLPRKEADILWQRFHEACERNFTRCAPYFAEQARLGNEALNRKEELCLEAEKLADSTDWKGTSNRLKELQVEWKGLASVQRHKEEKFYRRFRQACNHFFSRASIHFGERDQEFRRNLAQKIKLCEEIEAIANDPKPDQGGRVRELQAAWKAAGPVPKDESEAIWQRFKAGQDRFMDFLDSGLAENLQKKEALCAQVEALTSSVTEDSDMRALAEQLVLLKKEWGQIGPVSGAKSEAVRQRFSKSVNDFFALRQERLRQISVLERENLYRKDDLIKQAETLADLAVWDEAADETLRGLDRQWLEIGPSSTEMKAAFQEDFKGISEAFFGRQREYFVTRRKERLDNQRQKEILCLKLENLLRVKTSVPEQGLEKVLTLAEEMKLALECNFTYAGLRDDEQRLAEEVDRLEAEWRKIGPAPGGWNRIFADRFRYIMEKFHRMDKEGS